ncbi:MAG: lactonase family protein, partial [Planctomycetia bacterium]
SAAEQLVWFGTYTGQGTGSEGIYVARFDDQAGTFGPVELAAKTTTPSFIALHPTLPVLYAACEFVGTVEAFTIDEATGKLAPTGRGAAWACHLSVTPRGSAMLAAGGAGVACLQLGADGGIGSAVVLAHKAPPGVGAKSFPHSAYPTPDGRFAVACDMNFDRVFVHALDAAKPALATHGEVALPAGTGPRHFAFHPGGRHGYAVNEKNATVTAFAFDPEAGVLSELQTISTLPEGTTDKCATAEIAIHPSGRFLYASNRGPDSIAMYAVDATTGKLSFLGAEPIRGKEPRNFVIAPGGRFLLAAGQHSASVTVFAIDPDSGRLEFTGTKADVPTPTCIRFRPAG